MLFEEYVKMHLDHFNSRWNYLAMDEDMKWFFYVDKPVRTGAGGWHSKSAYCQVDPNVFGFFHPLRPEQSQYSLVDLREEKKLSDKLDAKVAYRYKRLEIE